MTKLEFLQKIKFYIKEIDRFNSELKSRFPNCENNLELRNFIDFSQNTKADFLRKIEQYSNMSDESFSKIPTLDFMNKNADSSFKSIELHYKTIINGPIYIYKPSDPNKKPIL